MEHHHNSYTQTEQQTPLGDHTATTNHQDKKLESPTCTDFANNHLEDLQLDSTRAPSLDGTYAYHSQQQQQSIACVGTDTNTLLDPQHESIGDEDNQVLSQTVNNNAGEPHSLQGAGDIDETVEDVLEPRAGNGNTGDDHTHGYDSADSRNVAAEITTDSNSDTHHEPPSCEMDSTLSTETGNDNSDSLDDWNNTTTAGASVGTTPLPPTTSEEQHHVNIDSLGTAALSDGDDTNNHSLTNDNDEMEIGDDDNEMQQQDVVDQLNTNMTSGDDKEDGDKNCIMNQSVDPVDTYFCHQSNSPPGMDRNTEASPSTSTTTTTTTNQGLDPTLHNDTPPFSQSHSQHSLADNSTNTVDHTTTPTENSTTDTIETSISEVVSSISPSPPYTTFPHIIEQTDTTDAIEDNNHDREEEQQQQQEIQLDGDEHILDGAVAQQQDTAQSITISPQIASGSISTEQPQPSQIISDDHHQLNRMNTTGSDEHTLSEPPRPRHVWESDRQASECRRCSRRFSFLVRRHHCRRCGQIVCDRCSSHRVRLPVEEIVEDPLISTSHYPLIALNPQRVCETCVRIPIKAAEPTPRYASSSQYNNHQAGHSTLGFGHPRLRPMNMERTNSQQSLMADCPVCGTGLLGMGKQQQEHHLNQCLNAGSPTVHPPRYIIYTLTEGTAQLGDECPICFEEFEVGDKIARMVCLCSYHRHCLRDWLERGKGCPIHYDSNFGAY